MQLYAANYILYKGNTNIITYSWCLGAIRKLSKSLKPHISGAKYTAAFD